MKDSYEKRGYLLEDFRLFHLRDAAGTSVDYHYHEFCKVLLLVSGSGGYVVDGRRYRLEPGDVVLIGSQVPHRPEFEPGVPYERCIIYIDPKFLASHSDADCDLSDIFLGSRSVLRPGEEERVRLWEIAGALENELREARYGHGLVSRGLLLRLLVEMQRCLQGGDSRLAKPMMPRDERVVEILRYIDAHLTEELDADVIAEAFYVSKYHMMRRFKAETGQSLHGYILQRRLHLARDLMVQGESVTDACFHAGFKSYSSFYRGYVKLFGAAPTGKPDGREGSFE